MRIKDHQIIISILVGLFAFAVWRWSQRVLESAYMPLPAKDLVGKIPKDGQEFGGTLLVTVNLGNVPSSPATDLFPTNDNGSPDVFGVGAITEGGSNSSTDSRKTVSEKHERDVGHLLVADCYAGVVLVVALVTFLLTTGELKGQRHPLAQFFNIAQVFGLAIIVVGVFLPWGTFAMELTAFVGDFYRLGAINFPVIGSALPWGDWVLALTTIGMIVSLLPVLSRPLPVRRVLHVIWIAVCVSCVGGTVFQLNHTDLKSSDVWQGYLTALRSSGWLYSLPLCALTGVILKYRLFDRDNQRIWTVTIMGAACLIPLALSRLDHTRYKWKSEISTGLPFGYEIGQITAYAGVALTIVSGVILLSLVFRRRRWNTPVANLEFTGAGGANALPKSPPNTFSGPNPS